MPRQELEWLLDAWQKKSFSASEKVVLRSKLEWQGIPKDTIDKFLSSGEDNREIRYKENMSISANNDNQKIDTLTQNTINDNIDKTNTINDKINVETKKDNGITVNIETRNDKNNFSLQNIVIWSLYEWYIKLQFNYGLFVTVKWVEWLLHKNEIITPEWVNWKKYFNIGDPIQVIAKEIKEVDGVPRIVWTMKK